MDSGILNVCGCGCVYLFSQLVPKYGGSKIWRFQNNVEDHSACTAATPSVFNQQLIYCNRKNKSHKTKTQNRKARNAKLKRGHH